MQPFRTSHSRCPSRAMPLPSTTLLSHSNDRREQESQNGGNHHLSSILKIVLFPSLFFPNNLEATEQASQPVNEQNILVLFGDWQLVCLQGERPLSSSSLVSHSESLSWLLDTNQSSVSPTTFTPRFLLLYSPTVSDLLRETRNG